jgi:hypothetical protein
VREVVRRRASRLPEKCGEMLEMAAVIGRSFYLPLLARLLGQEEEEVLSLLEPAVDAELLEEVEGEVEQYRFSHALVGDALSGELSRARRCRLHLRVGELLLEGRGSDPAETSRHFADSGALVDPERLLRAAVEAAVHTHFRSAPEEAETMRQFLEHVLNTRSRMMLSCFHFLESCIGYCLGNWQECREHALNATFLEGSERSGKNTWRLMFSLNVLAMIGYQTGDFEEAQRYLSRLADVSGQRDPAAPFITPQIVRITRDMDALDAAARFFEDAMTFCHRAKFRPELAWNCLDYAALRIRRSRPADLARARRTALSSRCTRFGKG